MVKLQAIATSCFSGIQRKMPVYLHCLSSQLRALTIKLGFALSIAHPKHHGKRGRHENWSYDENGRVVVASEFYNPSIDVRSRDRGERGKEIIQAGVRADVNGVGQVHDQGQRVDVDARPADASQEQQDGQVHKITQDRKLAVSLDEGLFGQEIYAQEHQNHNDEPDPDGFFATQFRANKASGDSKEQE